MRRSLLFWMVLPALAFGQEKSSKPQVSADGVFSIRLVEKGEGHCEVEVTREQQPAWTLSACPGTVNDFYFVSGDGEKFWVLKSMGEKPAPKKGKPGPWVGAVVATLYDKAGTVLRKRRASDLVPGTSRGEVRHLERHFKWLEGVAGVPGRGPRLNDKNEVEFEVVGGKNTRLIF